MRRGLAVIAAALSLSLATSEAASAAPIEVGHIPECLEVVPAAISVDNTPVTLNVRVLLDGASLQRGQQTMQTARSSYSPLGIDLVASFESVSFTGNVASELIQQAKDRYGGTRPAGIDIVYVLTPKDITEPGVGDAVAGLADCIGGVAFDDSAFAVGEVIESDETSLLGLVRTGGNATAKIAAHEIGHLMGAHHHYANCVEGLLSELGTELSACTLMFNTVSLTSLNFSTVNGLVTKGHGQLYATP